MVFPLPDRVIPDSPRSSWKTMRKTCLTAFGVHLLVWPITTEATSLPLASWSFPFSSPCSDFQTLVLVTFRLFLKDMPNADIFIRQVEI